MNKEYECYRLIPSRTKRELNDWFDNCMKDGRTKESLIFELCQEYDIYFDYNLAENSRNLGDYIRGITYLTQYKEKSFKDGISNRSTIEINNSGIKCSVGKLKINDFKINILSELYNEQRLLLEKIKKAREEENIGTYKNLIQAFRDITYLVQNEERKLNYEKVYVEVDRDGICIYFKGEKTLIKVNNTDVMANKVKETLNYNKEVPIYMDIRTFGMAVYEALRIEDYNVIDTSNSIIKIN